MPDNCGLAVVLLQKMKRRLDMADADLFRHVHAGQDEIEADVVETPIVDARRYIVVPPVDACAEAEPFRVLALRGFVDDSGTLIERHLHLSGRHVERERSEAGDRLGGRTAARGGDGEREQKSGAQTERGA